MSDEDRHYPKSVSGQPLALEQRSEAQDGRRYSPSTGRNKDIVRATFLEHVLNAGRVLEIASGTGEHGAHTTQAALGIIWTYSDIDPAGHTSQTGWRQAAAHDRLLGPLMIDTTTPDWGLEHAAAGYQALFCANMIHIAPFEAAVGLLTGAGAILKRGGRLCFYGPFSVSGEMAPSNARFSEDLKRRDPSWGVRDLQLDIVPIAQRHGLTLSQVIEMPANNLTVVFEKF
ncbi:MAG: DUF938 domain-containing protein [Pseudomonadota bacterium]